MGVRNRYNSFAPLDSKAFVEEGLLRKEHARTEPTLPIFGVGGHTVAMVEIVAELVVVGFGKVGVRQDVVFSHILKITILAGKGKWRTAVVTSLLQLEHHPDSGVVMVLPSCPLARNGDGAIRRICGFYRLLDNCNLAKECVIQLICIRIRIV